MNKIDIFTLASICIVSAFCIYFFDEKKTRRKKIRKEIDEAIKNLKEDDNINNKRISLKK